MTELAYLTVAEGAVLLRAGPGPATSVMITGPLESRK